MKYTTIATISAKGHLHTFTFTNWIFKGNKAKCCLCGKTAKQLNLKLKL